MLNILFIPNIMMIVPVIELNFQNRRLTKTGQNGPIITKTGLFELGSDVGPWEPIGSLPYRLRAFRGPRAQAGSRAATCLPVQNPGQLVAWA